MSEIPTIIRNSLNGEVKLVTVEVFLGRFTDDFSRRALERSLLRKGVEGAIMFENLNVGARQSGQISTMTFGKGCTYKTLEEATKVRLGTVPSTFQYPVQYILARQD